MRKAVAVVVMGALASLALAFAAAANHPRPGAGSPVRVPLVSAFGECTEPNSTHVAPLASGSCSPPEPVEISSTALGKTGAGIGFVTLHVFCSNGATPPCGTGDPDTQDVAVSVHLSDVRCLTVFPGCSALGADYEGSFLITSLMRLTDHANGSPPSTCTMPSGAAPCVAATTTDFTMSLAGDCTDNGGPNGGVCALTTTLDTAIPGMVKELQRMVMALRGGVGLQLLDAGPDGTLSHGGLGCPPVCGTGDEQPVASQGVFAP